MIRLCLCKQQKKVYPASTVPSPGNPARIKGWGGGLCLAFAVAVWITGCSTSTGGSKPDGDKPSVAGVQENAGAPMPSATSSSPPSSSPSSPGSPAAGLVKPLGAAGELASYYDRHLAVKDGVLYGWTTGSAKPQRLLENVLQAGVGDTASYALLTDGRLAVWEEDPAKAAVFVDGIVSFSAGKTGVLAIKKDGTLLHFASRDKPGTKIAKDVVFSSVGDGTDYYITGTGELFAKGLAHRGQYGDGRLESTDEFIQVAGEAVQVRGHTGHAVMLQKNGDVQGTGGNIYGPLGKHGLGDKATTWGIIFTGATMIATGSSHSAALKEDGTLWIWGANEGTEPRQVLEQVTTVAAGKDVTLAKTKDGSVWFWRTGEKPDKVLE